MHLIFHSWHFHHTAHRWLSGLTLLWTARVSYISRLSCEQLLQHKGFNKKYKSLLNQETNTSGLYTFSVSLEKPKPPFIIKLPRLKIEIKRKCHYAQLIKIGFYHLSYIIYLKYG